MLEAHRSRTLLVLIFHAFLDGTELPHTLSRSLFRIQAHVGMYDGACIFWCVFDSQQSLLNLKRADVQRLVFVEVVNLAPHVRARGRRATSVRAKACVVGSHWQTTTVVPGGALGAVVGTKFQGEFLIDKEF